MKNIIRISLFVLLASASFSTHLTAETLVLGNISNKDDIDSEILKSMLVGKERFWSNGSEVVIAVLKSDPDADKTLHQFCGMSQSRFKNHWMRIAYSGRGKMPKLFNDLDDLIAFVNKNQGAIAIAPKSSSTKVLRKLN